MLLQQSVQFCAALFSGEKMRASLVQLSIGIFFAYFITTSALAADNNSNNDSGNSLSCDTAYASPDALWPPNHKYKSINIEGLGASDAVVSIQCIKQDEPRNSTGDGNTDLDGKGIGSSVAEVRSERQGFGNGRVYHIGFNASIPNGDSCAGTVTVGVPKNRQTIAVDDGPLYDSTDHNLACDGAVNQAPIIVSTAILSATAGDAYLYDVDANDPDQDTLTYELSSAPAGMTIDSVTGEINWLTDSAGQFEVVVRVTDPAGASDTQSFLIDVMALPNTPPLAIDQSLTVAEDTTLNILLGGTDPENNPLTFMLINQPANGQLSGTAPNLQYTPADNFTGSDTFQFIVNDGELDSASATISIEVLSVNDVPIAESQTLSTQENTTITITLNATDADNDPLTYAVISNPTNGTLSGTAPNLEYLPNPNFAGNDQFTFSASDTQSTSNEAIISISVQAAPNVTPNAEAGVDQQLEQGATVLLNGSGSYDDDGDTLTYNWVLLNSPAGSSVSIASPTAESTQVTLDSEGSYEFQLIVNDGIDDSLPDQVTITILPATPNTKPIANAGTDTQAEFSESVTLDGSGSFDPENDSLTYNWLLLDSPEGSQSGFSDPQAVDSLFFGDTAGDYTLELIVNDGSLNSDPDTVVITVGADPQNLTPVALASWYIRFDELERGLWLELDGSTSVDPDGDELTYMWRIINQDPNDNSVLENSDQVFASLLREGFNELNYFDYTIELTVSDGVNTSDPYVFDAPAQDLESPFVFFQDFEESRPVGDTINLQAETFGNNITFEWTILSSPSASQTSFSDANASQTELTLDAAGTYVVQLRTNFGLPGHERLFQKTIKAVNPNNQIPVAVISAPENIIVDDISVVVTLDGSASFDLDNDDLTYEWLLFAPTGSLATLDDATAATTTFIADVRGSYFVELIVDDGQESGDSETDVFAEGSQPNSLPVANAGPDLDAVTAQIVTLSGAASSDPDNDPLDFYWSVESSPSGSSAQPAQEDAMDTTFVPDLVGQYELLLEVGDWDGFSSDTLIINVTAGNVPPIAVINIDSSNPKDYPIINQGFLLDGSDSYDTDGGTLTYSWQIANRPVGSAATLTNSDTVAPTFTADILGDYVLRLTVSDGEDTASRNIFMQAYVENNQAPIAIISAPDTGDVGVSIELDGTAAYDPDGDEIQARGWEVIFQPPFSRVTFGVRNQPFYSFTGDKPGLYIVGYAVSDGQRQSVTTNKYITLIGDNQIPVANAGADINAQVGDTVSLNGSLSSDPDQNTLSYAWSLLSSPTGSTPVLQSATTINPSFTADLAGAYTISLIVNDGFDNSVPDTVTVNVSESNLPPVANAGLDQETEINVPVLLDGSASSDPENNTLTYAWSVLSSPTGSVFNLSSANSVQSNFSADTLGEYQIVLSVNDGSFDSASDVVIITVVDDTGNNNQPPVAVLDFGPDNGNTVNLDASQSSDPEGASLSFQWNFLAKPEGSNANIWPTDSATPSFNIDLPGRYEVQLIVSDGELFSTPDAAALNIAAPDFVPSLVMNPLPSNSPLAGTLMSLSGSHNALFPIQILVGGSHACEEAGAVYANNIIVEPGISVIDTTLIHYDSAEPRLSDGVEKQMLSVEAQFETPFNVEIRNDCGITPLRTTLSIRKVNSEVDQLLVDFEGDGVADDVMTDDFKEYSILTTTPGLRQVVITATIDGQPAAHRLFIVAKDRDELAAELEAIWNGFYNSLSLADSSSALEYMTTPARERYEPIFNNPMADIPSLVAGWTNFQLESISDEYAEFSFNQDMDGQQMLHLVTFVNTIIGVWKIEGL